MKYLSEKSLRMKKQEKCFNSKDLSLIFSKKKV